MSAKQIQEVKQRLFIDRNNANGKSSADAKKLQSWEAFKHATANAGTGPALEAIKNWVEKGDVRNEKAAELVAVLPRTARLPTDKYIKTFFQFATSSNVVNQKYLNSTIIIGFSEILRKAQVDSDNKHMRYGVHSFGHLTSKNDQSLQQEYLPYLEEKLKSAFEKGDSQKIIVYIQALGNTAHPRLLKTFEPYLEGKKSASRFQRLLMVASLYQMTRVHPTTARAVLYRIYKNPGEAPELRVAALHLLANTNPPAAMLQRIAQQTNWEQSKQVISATQSFIRSAANMDQNPDSVEFARNAQSAVDMLNPADYGYSMSKNYLSSYVIDNIDKSYESQISSIGSFDSIFPSSVFVNFMANDGGYKHQVFHHSAMFSSVNDLLELVNTQFKNNNNNNSNRRNNNRSGSHDNEDNHSNRNSNNEWTAENVFKALNIQKDQAEQLEGNIFLTMLGGKRAFAINNHTIEKIPAIFKEAAQKLKHTSFNLTQFYSKNTMKVAFPTPMGLPFVYASSVPTMVYVGGETKVNSHPDLANGNNNFVNIPQYVNMSADIEAVYSMQANSKFGTVAPFNHHEYYASVERNIQFYTAVQMDANIDIDNKAVELRVQPLNKEDKQNVFQYSTVLFTTKSNILNFNPALQEEGTERVHVGKAKQIQQNFGKDSTGFAFEASYWSEKGFGDLASLYQEVSKFDVQSALTSPWAQSSLNPNNITVAFKPSQSSSKVAKFTFSYSDNSNNNSNNHNDNNSHDSNNNRADSSAAHPSSTAANSESRQNEFLHKVASGISGANAMVVDVSAKFQDNHGQSSAQYVATLALANSDASPNARVLFFASMDPANSGSSSLSKAQVCAAAASHFPNVPLMNFNDALKANPDSHITAEVAFGSNCNAGGHIRADAKLSQTQEFQDFAKNRPMAKKCFQLMQKGQALEYACQNATKVANMLNKYDVSIKYDRVPNAFKNVTYNVYSALAQVAFPYLSENMFSQHSNPSGKIDLNARFNYNLHYFNASINSPFFTANFKNVEVDPAVRPLVIFHPSLNSLELMSYNENYDYPTCSVSKNSISTFDNKTYSADLEGWHVMFASTPKNYNDNSGRYSVSNSQSNSFYKYKKVAILAKNAGSQRKAVKMLLGDNVIDINPSGSDSNNNSPNVNVQVNGNKMNIANNRLASFDDFDGETLVEISVTDNGEVQVQSPSHGIAVNHDGANFMIDADSYYSGEVRGLCGTYSGDKYTDFTTPKKCILREAKLFAATYALSGSSSNVEQLKRQAEQVTCFKRHTIFADVITSNDYDRSSNNNNRNSKLLSMPPFATSDSSSSSTQLVQDIKNNGDHVCFSIRPIPKCQHGSSPAGSSEKEVQYLCISQGKNAEYWAEQIRSGRRVNLEQKQPNATFKKNIPKGCVRDN